MSTLTPPLSHRASLEDLAAALIERAIARCASIEEGEVMSLGPPPYRRLDCDGRALAYVRIRHRARVVRVDVSGLWAVARRSPLIAPSAAGAATLRVASADDLEEAVELLAETVAFTRRARGQDRAAPAPRGPSGVSTATWPAFALDAP
jgi:hypothetical protein